MYALCILRGREAVPGGQKKISNPLELKLEVVVSHLMRVLEAKLRSSAGTGSAFKNSFRLESWERREFWTHYTVFTFADVAMETSLIAWLLLANLSCFLSSDPVSFAWPRRPYKT